MGLNGLGFTMYILNMLQIQENDGKVTSFLAAFYYFVRVFGYLENDEVQMNEYMNGENADLNLGILVAELIEHYGGGTLCTHTWLTQCSFSSKLSTY